MDIGKLFAFFYTKPQVDLLISSGGIDVYKIQPDGQVITTGVTTGMQYVTLQSSDTKSGELFLACTTDFRPIMYIKKQDGTTFNGAIPILMAFNRNDNYDAWGYNGSGALSYITYNTTSKFIEFTRDELVAEANSVLKIRYTINDVGYTSYVQMDGVSQFYGSPGIIVKWHAAFNTGGQGVISSLSLSSSSTTSGPIILNRHKQL